VTGVDCTQKVENNYNRMRWINLWIRQSICQSFECLYVEEVSDWQDCYQYSLQNNVRLSSDQIIREPVEEEKRVFTQSVNSPEHVG
jgi:hypothetical protein